MAKKLFEFMIADAKKRKLGKIELDVWEFNDSAIEFYFIRRLVLDRREDGWNMK